MYKGEDKVLEILSKNKEMTIQELSTKTSLNEDTVRRVVESLKASGHVSTKTSESFFGVPTEEFETYYASKFPEISVFEKALKKTNISDLSPQERSIGLRWAKVKGFVAIENGVLTPTKSEEEVTQTITNLRVAYDQIKKSGECSDRVIFDELFQRHLLKKKSVVTIKVSYTGKAFSAQQEGFNLNVPASDAPLGKNHPITRIAKRIKGIMSEMGFEEIEGDIIESSFWNFDALFQPQDHPARELADTFYIDKKFQLPKDKSLVERIKKSHETGWRYDWNPDEACKAVLRTHTTCLSARRLASLKDKKPHKYFAIGKVFRNEATDYKHLAEFYQVEGIIAWENACFTDLLGTLKEFYRKLGFEKIRFRPSFFPYTEPSLEVEVYFEKKKQWLELGGAGIFRPEVTIPLGVKVPVIAWGLGLDRMAMVALDINDIRDLFSTDLDFIRTKRIKL